MILFLTAMLLLFVCLRVVLHVQCITRDIANSWVVFYKCTVRSANRSDMWIATYFTPTRFPAPCID